MNTIVTYERIYPSDYEILTKIMTSAFNEDTAMHTDLQEDGPPGYNDGSLIRKLNENKDCESFKIIFQNNIVGAYTVGIKKNYEFALEMLFISPDKRGHNLGTIVWKDIEQNYKEAKKWTIETPDYSIRNHYFYTKKCGFVFEKENVYENGEKSFIFKKEK